MNIGLVVVVVAVLSEQFGFQSDDKMQMLIPNSIQKSQKTI